MQLVLDASGATANTGNERYTVKVTNPDGQAAAAAVLRVVPGSSTAVGDGAVPGAFGLGDVRPNPSRGAVQMDYALAPPVHIRTAPPANVSLNMTPVAPASTTAFAVSAISCGAPLMCGAKISPKPFRACFARSMARTARLVRSATGE